MKAVELTAENPEVNILYWDQKFNFISYELPNTDELLL